MKLTQFTDYSLRVIIYLGLKNDRATVAEIAAAFGISQNHLVKVVHGLSRAGLVRSFKGKSGGLTLEPHVYDLKLGDVISKTEPNFHLVECFDRDHNTCPIMGVCALELVLHRAHGRFVEELNRHTLRELLGTPTRKERSRRLGLG